MMRAKTPADPMSASEKSRTLPTPKFQVGDRVRWDTGHPHFEVNHRYHLKLYARHLIKKWRHQDRGRLSDHVKKIIRDCLVVFQNATEAEVAGIRCSGMHGVDCAMYNECYVGGIPGASSPLGYSYQLLFRWEEDGNRKAMTTGIPVVCEGSLVKVG